jgi:branched-subunit amino acid aminotransferase/4-amino-4-deoxychorismate lyase
MWIISGDPCGCETFSVTMSATLDGVPVAPGGWGQLGLVNYGHFTSMRVETGGVRGLGAHLERLVRDCCRVFDTELDPERVRRYLRDTLDGVSRPILARVTVFDPALTVADPGADAVPSVLVTVRPAGGLSASVGGSRVRLSSAVYQRELAAVKHVGLFGPMRLRREAQRRGADDVLFIGADGAVCEASVANIGFIDGDRVVWPRADWLPGVTMRLIDEVADTATEAVDVADLGGLDAAFVTNAATGVRPVGVVDDVRWTGEPAGLGRLRSRYLGIRPEPI